MNNNDAIIDRIRGIPMQKGTWKDKFDPRNPDVPQANDNVPKSHSHSTTENMGE